MPVKFVKLFAVVVLFAVAACSDNGAKDVAGKWVRGDFSVDINAEKNTVDYVRQGASWLSMKIVKSEKTENDNGQAVYEFALEMDEIVPPQRKGLSIEDYEKEQAELKHENSKHKGKPSKLRVRVVNPNRIEAQITHPLGLSKEFTDWMPFVRYGSGETISMPVKQDKKPVAEEKTEEMAEDAAKTDGPTEKPAE